MTPGWLERAVVGVFGDDAEDACQVCGGHCYVELVAFAGELMDGCIPCPCCRVDPPPWPIYVYNQRPDTPRGAV